MARKANVFPSYLLHKQSGQARVRINGRDFLLGPYGSESSRITCGQMIGQLSGGSPIDPISQAKRGRLPRNDSDPGPSVAEICLAFLRHAETHYVKNGKQTSEVQILKSVMKPLNDIYGLTPANEFGPLALTAVRAKMIESGWKRITINAAMSRIRRIFKHAIANELIDCSVLQRLQTVAPLLADRTEASDKPDVLKLKNIAELEQLLLAFASGSTVSPKCLFQNRFIKLSLRKKTLQPSILNVQLLQPPGLFALHATKLIPPPVIRRLADLQGL
jgi:hypothetical protein